MRCIGATANGDSLQQLAAAVAILRVFELLHSCAFCINPHFDLEPDYIIRKPIVQRIQRCNLRREILSTFLWFSPRRGNAIYQSRLLIYCRMPKLAPIGKRRQAQQRDKKEFPTTSSSSFEFEFELARSSLDFFNSTKLINMTLRLLCLTWKNRSLDDFLLFFA